MEGGGEGGGGEEGSRNRRVNNWTFPRPHRRYLQKSPLKSPLKSSKRPLWISHRDLSAIFKTCALEGETRMRHGHKLRETSPAGSLKAAFVLTLHSSSPGLHAFRGRNLR